MGPDRDNQSVPNPGEKIPSEDSEWQESSPPPEESTGRQPQVGGPHKGRKKTWLLWVIIVLLILTAGVFAWLWWQEKDKNADTATDPTAQSSSQQQTEAEESACTEGFTEYENEDLGLAFCYPTDWGKVTVVDGKFAEADTGQRWTVQFADKPMVNLGVVTEDWSTEVARDGTCVDPAVQTLPAFSPFSTDWVVTDSVPVTDGTRGIEVMADKYLINEEVDSLLTNGVCIHGYTIIANETYPHTAASYYAEFSGAITTPQQHIDSPNTLISEADREDFYAFAKSVKALEDES